MGIGIILGFGFVRLKGFGTVQSFTGATESSWGGIEADALSFGWSPLALDTASSVCKPPVDIDIDIPTFPVAFRSICYMTGKTLGRFFSIPPMIYVSMYWKS